jgi:DNA-binding NarL/FixJ family response regulator
MPRKNGFECLSEIKLSSKLKLLPVIVFSTSFEPEVVNQLYQNGAQYYIHKSSEFSQFKEIILHALRIIEQGNTAQPAIENFVIKLQRD